MCQKNWTGPSTPPSPPYKCNAQTKAYISQENVPYLKPCHVVINIILQPLDFLMSAFHELFFSSNQIPDDLTKTLIDCDLGFISTDGESAAPYIIYLAETCQVTLEISERKKYFNQGQYSFSSISISRWSGLWQRHPGGRWVRAYDYGKLPKNRFY